MFQNGHTHWLKPLIDSVTPTNTLPCGNNVRRQMTAAYRLCKFLLDEENNMSLPDGLGADATDNGDHNILIDDTVILTASSEECV